MNQLNNNHSFKLKQLQMFAKLLSQAKDRVQAELQEDDSFDQRIEAEVLPKLAAEQGAFELIAKIRKLRKELDDSETALSKVGFDCSEDSISLKYNAPKTLSEALEAAKRSARQERNKVLKKYDLAILNVWASSDASKAKKIVEELL